MNYNDWKVLFTKDFWSKKEISYQYVHFTNSALITIFGIWFYCSQNVSNVWMMFFVCSGFMVGVFVELYQWIKSKKFFDMIRDLFFWLAGNIVGYLIYYK